MGQTASGAFDGSGTGTFSGGMERDVICRYDFAKQLGAVGSIVIGTVPAGALIQGGKMIVDAGGIVGAGATAGIDVEATSDIVTAAAVSGAPWSTAGKKAINPKGNTPESSSVLTTVARNVVLTITAAPLTAGSFTLYLKVF